MMRYIKIFIFSFALLCVGKAEAQVLSIMDMKVDSKSLSMGYVDAVPGNAAFSSFSNVAMGAYSDESVAFAGTYGVFQPMKMGVQIAGISGFYKISPDVSLSVGAIGSIYRKMTLKNEVGLSSGTYTPNEYQVKLGCSYKVDDYLAVGLSAGYAQSLILPVKSYNAASCDCYVVGSLKGIKASLGVKNIGYAWGKGYEASFGKYMSASLGLLYSTEIATVHCVDFSAQYDYYLSGQMSVSAGVQYIYDESYSFRIGGRYGMDGIPSFLSLGPGFERGIWGLSAAYVIPIKKGMPYGNTFNVTFAVRL